uniref:Uncharacterized protein n=1 Tax=Trypanosoma congolense (strain IL3000) TaxID=1068625 RepID=G0UW73_TRYCI|nr:conserved hypothetical protein [Trypanosoma congolense IL3000]
MMYSDGTRKTMSELQRIASTTRRRIAEESAHLEQLSLSTSRTRALADRLLDLFACGATSHEKSGLMRVLNSFEPDMDISEVPLIPVAIALANGQLPFVKRLRAAGNSRVNDDSVILLSQVLRFSPGRTQLEQLDISGTKVTERGLTFLLEMMADQGKPFTLVARNLVRHEACASPDHAGGATDPFRKALEKARATGGCTTLL